MFSFFKKKPLERPSKSQVLLCERLGLQIQPKMSRKNVSKLLERSLRQDKYKRIYEEIQREREEESEKEERATYGDDIYDEQKKWESYCDPFRQYLMVFKRGGKIQSDVVELESADIVGEKRYSIQLGVLLPRHQKDRDSGDYIEWVRDVSLKPDNVLKFEALPKPIDMFDVESYVTTKTRCNALADEFKMKN